MYIRCRVVLPMIHCITNFKYTPLKESCQLQQEAWRLEHLGPKPPSVVKRNTTLYLSIRLHKKNTEHVARIMRGKANLIVFNFLQEKAKYCNERVCLLVCRSVCLCAGLKKDMAELY